MTGIFIFSSWVFVSASNDELVSWLNYPEVKWLFVNCLTGNSIAFNLSLGFIVSSIFYFFVAYLPEKRRQKHLKPMVKKRLEKTLEKSTKLFKCLLKYSSAEVELHSLKKSDFKDICNKFEVRKNLNEGRLGVAEYPVEGKYYRGTPGVLLVSSWFQFVESINYLDGIILTLNDEELTAIVYELDLKPLNVVMRTIISTGSDYFDDYESILVHIFDVTKKLSAYHKDNIDSGYVDPLRVKVADCSGADE